MTDDWYKPEPPPKVCASPAPIPTGEPVAEDDLLSPEQAWDIHINRDDRNSPEKYPEMALITFDELADFMRRAAPPAQLGVDAVTVSKAAADVLAERRRQIESEGWTPEHDDKHADGELAKAAACYAAGWKIDVYQRFGFHEYRQFRMWPWHPKWWKPKDRRHDLVRAAALIIAEIERIDRTHPKEG